MKRATPIFAAAFVLIALPLCAGELMTYVDRSITKKYPLDVSGAFWIHNPTGSIEINGVDGDVAMVTAVRTTSAPDRDLMAVARDNSALSFDGGGGHQLVVRTLVPPVHDPRWSASVTYTISVPRTVSVHVAAPGSRPSDTIRIVNMMGNVTVNSFNGTIVLDNVSGPSIIDTVNGKVVYNYPSKPMSSAQIRATNADIEVRVPRDANFDWIADTLRTELWSTMPSNAFHGRWDGHVFRGNLNGSGGPLLTAATVFGRISVLTIGTTLADARRVSTANQQADNMVSPQNPARKMIIQLPSVNGPFEVIQRVADVTIGEARGSLRVYTGAGAIDLGTLYGDTTATSLGGPIKIANALGPLIARTGVGRLFVHNAKVGGTMATDGGFLEIDYTGGATTLKNGGGNITVRRAAGPIEAETRSGDIIVSADPTQKTQRINARTSHGNVTVNLTPRFGAEIDATVLTSDNDSEVIFSDFSGLQIRKEQVAGGKTKVHATGKINGGGDRIELYSEEGTIHISSSVRP